MRIKTSELSGAALDWAVATCEGLKCDVPAWAEKPWVRITDPSGLQYVCPSYSTSWAQGGPIIEREGISWHCGNKTSWHAYGYGSADNFSGPTPLIAAMRCYVASKLGDEVDVPGGLV